MPILGERDGMLINYTNTTIYTSCSLNLTAMVLPLTFFCLLLSVTKNLVNL